MRFIIYVSIFFGLSACSNDPSEIKSPLTNKEKVEDFLPALHQYGLPLSPEPLVWTNTELAFLDQYKQVSILGLGEATHGTSEFFDAKFRMLRYMVENHGFKGIAMEADFGESIYLNRLLANGEVDKVVDVMKDKMLFWTWKNEETKRMIEWMVEYNTGKEEQDRIHYVGVDCQNNIHNIQLLKDYLDEFDPVFGDSTRQLLSELQDLSITNETIEKNQFQVYKQGIENISTYLIENENQFPDETTVELYQHLVKVIAQVVDVNYFYSQQDFTENFRDKYMALNTEWYYNHLGRQGLVLWAHNFHVANDQSYRSMGRDLRRSFGDKYGIIGFSFSKGSFTAVHKVGSTWLGLKTLTIEDEPLTSSLNGKLHYADIDDYIVDFGDLNTDDAWKEYFQNGIRMLTIGSTYFNNPNLHYQFIDDEDFDKMIYVRSTKTANPL